MEDRRKAYIFMILALLVGGAVSPVIKVGLQSMRPIQFAFFRFLIASVLFLPLLLQRKHIHVRQVVSLVPVSLLATVNIILFVLGIQRTTAIMGQLLYAAAPFFIALFGFIFWSRRLTKRQVVGISVGLVGVGVTVLAPARAAGRAFAGDLRGNLLVLCGVVCWSLYILASKKQQITHSPLALTASVIFTTAMALCILVPFELRYYSATLTAGWNYISIWSLLYVAILGTVGGYMMNQYLIKHGGSLFAASSNYVTPLVASVVAYILLGETLTPAVIAGGGLALVGVFLTTKSTQ